MAITKDKKREIIAKVSDALSKATSAVFVRFHKLTVADTAAMRRALKREGVGYYVAKKTLLRLALEKQGYAGQAPDMEGEIALAWSEGDSTSAARGIYEHAKKYKGALTIMGGIFENAFADAAKMTAIATIPSMPILRGMFANVINSPLQRFAIALSEVAKTKNA
jgi:large subunit ribosomal protein L10